MSYAEYVYNIIEHDCLGMDSVYEDYILKLVGEYGLLALKSEGLIEGCGVINGRQLYVLSREKHSV